MMTPLADARCIAYPSGSPALSKPEALQLLTGLHADWQVSADGRSLVRRFGFAEYRQTIAFVNAVAAIAECEDHHPELVVSYATCRVTFDTHTVNGLSMNDFICAAKVDRLPT